MRKVNNKKIISLLSKRSIHADWKKNMITVFAVALTAVLFTSLFTMAEGVKNSMQESSMRQVGTRSHAGFSKITLEQYDKIKQDKRLKDISYDRFLGLAQNESLNKLQVEIRYSEEKSALWGFSYPTTGKMPYKRTEIALSSIVLKEMGIKKELGETVRLELVMDGKKIEDTFTICGIWEGDPVAMAQTVWLSKEYSDEICPIPDEIDWYKDGGEAIGLINASFWFTSSFQMSDKVAALMKEYRLDQKRVETEINWAYLDIDLPASVLIGMMAAVGFILFTGYLVIYNIFYISISKDIRFYGLLKTIGTTGRQLKKLVWRQALFISVIGIPLGLFGGFLVGNVLTTYAMEIYTINTDIVVPINPVIFLLAAVFTLITVFISCIRPCRLVGKISPVEAVKYEKANKRGSLKQVKLGKVSPLGMALRNSSKNYMKIFLVAASFALCLITLNCVYTIYTGFDMDMYVSKYLTNDFEVTDYTNAKGGKKVNLEAISKEFQAAAVSQQGIIEIGLVYGDLTVLQLEETAYQNVIKQIDNYKDYYGDNQEKEIKEIRDKKKINNIVYGVDEIAFSKLDISDGDVDWETFQTGDYIIVNVAAAGSETGSWCYQAGDEVSLEFPDGSRKTYEVLANGSLPYSMGYGLYYGAVHIQVILPEKEYLSHYGERQPMLMVLNAESKALDSIEKWLDDYTSKEEINLYYQSRNEYKKEFESFRFMYVGIGGALSIILGLIGLLNFLNASIVSIWTRRRELAMMEAMGMTKRQQKKMLMYEGLLYGGIGVLLSVLGFLIMGEKIVMSVAGIVFYFRWHFTLLPIAAVLPAVFFIGTAVPHLIYKNISKDSLIERLK